MRSASTVNGIAFLDTERLGMDEGGRGALAGPLVAAGVIIGDELRLGPSYNHDTKHLAAHLIRRWAEYIKQRALVYAIGVVSVEELNELGLAEGQKLAYARALLAIEHLAPHLITDICIDGSVNHLPDDPRVRTLEKADVKLDDVKAAGILASDAFNRLMEQVSVQYPEYGWERNHGYGTKQHLDALKTFGISPLHRTQYAPIRELIKQGGVGINLGGVPSADNT